MSEETDYYISIEDELWKNGLSLTLVTKQFKTAKEMYNKGVPLGLIVQVIRELVDKSDKRITSFNYFTNVIWEKFVEYQKKQKDLADFDAGSRKGRAKELLKRYGEI